MLNQVLNDKSISWECKGLLLFLLHFPNLRTVKEVIHANVCSPSRTRRIIRELMDMGFIENQKNKNAKGQFTGVLVVKQ